MVGEMDGLAEGPVLQTDDVVAAGDTRDGGDFRNCALKGGAVDSAGLAGSELFISFIVHLLGSDPVDLILVGLKTVVAPFILCVEDDQHATGEADGEAGNVDNGNDLVAPKIANRDNQIIFEHKWGL